MAERRKDGVGRGRGGERGGGERRSEQYSENVGKRIVLLQAGGKVNLAGQPCPPMSLLPPQSPSPPLVSPSSSARVPSPSFPLTFRPTPA
eukprot:768775-Hanusia_phi.AAC.9